MTANYAIGLSYLLFEYRARLVLPPVSCMVRTGDGSKATRLYRADKLRGQLESAFSGNVILKDIGGLWTPLAFYTLAVLLNAEPFPADPDQDLPGTEDFFETDLPPMAGPSSLVIVGSTPDVEIVASPTSGAYPILLSLVASELRPMRLRPGTLEGGRYGVAA